MSVRVAERGASRTEYLEAARKLAVDVSQITANGPKKYRMSHGDHMVQTALKIYEHVQIAQSIYVAKGTNMERDHAQRRWHLKEAKGLANHLCGIADVYFALVMKCDGCDRKKAVARLERIGKQCARLIKLLGGVMDWDSNHIRKLKGASYG